MARIKWDGVIDKSVGIIQSFLDRNIIPTVRAVFYALVSKEIVPNTQSVYKQLSSKLVGARKEGIVAWTSIADDTRRSLGGDNMFWDPEEFAKDYVDYILEAHEKYTLPRWTDQDYYVEIWLEKFALARTFESWVGDMKIVLVPSRGYSSWTFLYKAQKRIRQKVSEGKEVVVLYFGDFDPSGVDIERFIEERKAES